MTGLTGSGSRSTQVRPSTLGLAGNWLVVLRPALLSGETLAGTCWRLVWCSSDLFAETEVRLCGVPGSRSKYVSFPELLSGGTSGPLSSVTCGKIAWLGVMGRLERA